MPQTPSRKYPYPSGPMPATFPTYFQQFLEPIDVDVAGALASITALTTRMTNAEKRLTTAEGKITAAEKRVTTAEGKITAAEKRLAAIESKYTALDKELDALAAKTGSDTGWVKCAIGNGYKAQGDGPTVRKVGQVVFIRGGISATGIKTTADHLKVFTVPSGYRPGRWAYLRAATSSGRPDGTWVIDATGVAELRTNEHLASFYMLHGAWLLN